jgi:5'-3' exonuclease
MTIKDLIKELRKRYPDVVRKEVLLSTFAGLKLGLDVFIWAYVYMYAARQEVLKHLENVLYEEPNPKILRCKWLEHYFNLIMAFIECGICIVPVFDGPPFRLKQSTKEERLAKYEAGTQKVAELRSKLAADPTNGLIIEDLKTAMASQIFISEEDKNALREMFYAMGLPVIEGKYEGEAICARLARRGLVAGVVSNDGDTLAHGAKIMISNVKRGTLGGKKPRHTCTVILLSDVHHALRMDHATFRDFCILLGTDYSLRMKMCGFVNALKALKKEGTLEKVVKLWIKNGKATETCQLADPAFLHEVRSYFANDFDDCLPDFPLVVNYANGFRDWIEVHMYSWVKDQMKSNLGTKLEILKGFNRKFAEQEKFVLIVKEDVKLVEEASY